MRLVRGRASTPEADRRATAAMLEETAETGVPAFRAWTPHRQVIFGRRDAGESGYEAARRAAEERGFPPLRRRTGGRAVAYTGRTVAFAEAVPVDDPRTGLSARYDEATERLRRALAGLGVDARPGEPPEAFCPGDHSLQCDGKVAGLAQRIGSGAALVGGVVVVGEREVIAGVLDPVYEALGIPFDPDSVGSVAAAGGPDDPDPVVAALVESFLDGRDPDVERAGDLLAAGD
ncbi:MAG: lipoate--protein ligase family protein [Salinigranum sp.]